MCGSLEWGIGTSNLRAWELAPVDLSSIHTLWKESSALGSERSTNAGLPVSHVPPWVVCEIKGHHAIPFQDSPPRMLPTVDSFSQPSVELFESFVSHRRARELVCRLPRQLLTFLRLSRNPDHPQDKQRWGGTHAIHDPSVPRCRYMSDSAETFS